MHDGQAVVLAEGISEEGGSGGNAGTHGVAAVGGRTDVLIEQMNERACPQIVEKSARISPAGLRAVEGNVVGSGTCNHHSLATSEVCGIEPAGGQAGHGGARRGVRIAGSSSRRGSRATSSALLQSGKQYWADC